MNQEAGALVAYTVVAEKGHWHDGLSRLHYRSVWRQEVKTLGILERNATGC